MEKKYCYATLITNEKYLHCIIRCKQTMEYFKTKYPFIALIPEGYNEMKLKLESNNILCREIKVDKFCSAKTLYEPFYEDTINKFQIFNLTEFEKVCFLDGDVILAGNLDSKFDDFLPNEQVHLYTDYDNNQLLTGMIFIVKPDSNFYSKKVLPLASLYENDEQILKHYFSHQVNLRKVPDEIVHFGGYIKPWDKGIIAFETIRKIFLIDDSETFVKKIENKMEFEGLMQEWFLYQRTPRAYAYVVFIKNKEDLDKAIALNQKMKNYGFTYSLIICLSNYNEEFMFSLLQHQIPFRIIQDDFSNIAKKIILSYQIFENDYYRLCIIDNLDLEINENFDYIFSKTLHPSIIENFLKKYENDIFFLKIFD